MKWYTKNKTVSYTKVEQKVEFGLAFRMTHQNILSSIWSICNNILYQRKAVDQRGKHTHNSCVAACGGCGCVGQKERKDEWRCPPLLQRSIWVGGASQLTKRQPEITHMQLCRCSKWLFYWLYPFILFFPFTTFLASQSFESERVGIYNIYIDGCMVAPSAFEILHTYKDWKRESSNDLFGLVQ